MENFDKKECGNGECKNSCHGGSCGDIHSMGGFGGCHGGKHHLKKIILMIIIVLIIFCSGFRLGEIVGSIRSGYGQVRGLNSWGMMRGYDNYSNNAPDINSGVLVPNQ